MDIIIVVHRKRSYGASFRDISIDILPGIDFLPCKLRLFRKDPVCRELLEKLKEDKIELIVLAGFLKILSADFIRHYENRIINVHPSLIPSFCGKGCYGLHVHEKALDYGVKVTGATVHFVNEIPDGGRIIYQKAVDVMDGDTPEILQKRVMEEAEWILLPAAVESVSLRILKGEI